MGETLTWRGGKSTTKSLSKGSREEFGGQGEEGGRKRREAGGEREGSSEFCTLFYFDLVELKLDFVETFEFE